MSVFAWFLIATLGILMLTIVVVGGTMCVLRGRNGEKKKNRRRLENRKGKETREKGKRDAPPKNK